MSQYQWKWQKVDKLGIWAFHPNDEATPPAGGFSVYVERCYEDLPIGWHAYLGPIPEIAPPEPKLRLPDGWTKKLNLLDVRGVRLWVVDIYDANGVHRGWWSHPDRATAIRAAQAAVDELEKQ